MQSSTKKKLALNVSMGVISALVAIGLSNTIDGMFGWVVGWVTGTATGIVIGDPDNWEKV